MTQNFLYDAGGTSVKGMTNPDEVLHAAGLDFTVEVEGMRKLDGSPLDGYQRVYPSYNPNLTWNVTKKVWSPYQNSDAMEFFAQVIARLGGSFYSAGQAKSGKAMWALVDLGSELEALPGDTIGQFLLLSHAHDGTMSIQPQFIPGRFTCGNSLHAARRTKGMLRTSVRHTGTAKERLEAFSLNLMQSIPTWRDTWMNDIADLVNEQFSEAEAQQVVIDTVQHRSATLREVERATSFEDLHVRQQPIAEGIWKLVNEGAGTDIPGVQGSGWGVYNAVVEYVDHYSNNDPAKRFDYGILGKGTELKDAALQLATRRLVL